MSMQGGYDPGSNYTNQMRRTSPYQNTGYVNPYQRAGGGAFGGTVNPYASPVDTGTPTVQGPPTVAGTPAKPASAGPASAAGQQAAAAPAPKPVNLGNLAGYDFNKILDAQKGDSPKYSFGRWFGSNVADPRQWSQSWGQFQATDPRWRGWTPQGDRLVYTGGGSPDPYFGTLRDIDVVQNYTGTGPAHYAWQKNEPDLTEATGDNPALIASLQQLLAPLYAQQWAQQTAPVDSGLAQMIGQLQSQFQAYQQQTEQAQKQAAAQAYANAQAANNPRFTVY